jgi:hypothetical protein
MNDHGKKFQNLARFFIKKRGQPYKTMVEFMQHIIERQRVIFRKNKEHFIPY